VRNGTSVFLRDRERVCHTYSTPERSGRAPTAGVKLTARHTAT
jgi:hypothetical protein